MPQKMISYALRKKGVSKDLVDGTIPLYNCCKTFLSVNDELLDSFNAQVGHELLDFFNVQRSVLSYLIFIIVMDVVMENVRGGSLMKFLYADNLIMSGKSRIEIFRWF